MFSSLVIHVLSKWVRRMSLVALVSCGGVVVLSTARPCAAASTAFDSAANPTYNTQPDGTTGWVTGSNGGHGFGPWQAFNVPSGFPFGGLVASSTTNGTGDLDNDGDINTPRNASGRAWGLAAAPASDGGVEGAPSITRPLNAPLSVGQTFKIDMDNGIVADPLLSNGMHFPGAVGWNLGTGPAPGAEPTFGLEALGGAKDYLLTTPTNGNVDTGIPVTYEGLHCEFTLLLPELPFSGGWMLKITPLSPGAPTYTLTGARPPVLLDELAVSDAGGGLDPANAVYFNNISVTDVPEPGGVGLVVGSAALLLRQRRRAEWS